MYQKQKPYTLIIVAFLVLVNRFGTKFATLLKLSILKGDIMDFYTNLKNICDSQNTNISTVLQNCGLSKSKGTNWKNGTEPTRDNIILLANYLNVSTDKLLLGKDPEIPSEYKQMIEIYEQLTPDNKDMAVKMFAAFFQIQTEREFKRSIKTIAINHSLLKASAGTGYELYGSDFDTINIIDTSDARKADFALTIEGDSMYPDYCNGDIVLVKQQPNIEVGQVGIFIINNSEGYIKEYGTDYLISRNPEYDNIIPTEDDKIECWGLVIGKATVIE